jgi:hypothetical protein
LFQEEYEKKSFEINNNYRLWDKSELDQRLNFMKEYFRRVETTNLFSSARLFSLLKTRGNTLSTPEYSSLYFKSAIDKLASFESYIEEKNENIQLNSKTKVVWKRKHGSK